MRLFNADIETSEVSAIGRLLRRLRRMPAHDQTSSQLGSSSIPLAQQLSGQIETAGAESVGTRRGEDSVGDESSAAAWLDTLSAALPNYEILMELGSGGQGVVYEALHIPANRRVAIKILRDAPLAGREHMDRFRREVELVGRLRHPNIVNLYETGEVLGRPYFVMEYIDGWPIDEHAVIQRPPVRQVVEWFERVCQAVSHAHQRGVIHRDLKASNILIDEAGEPRVLDFGLAKDLQGQDEHTAAGQVLGTLPYLAPEQVIGGAADADVRTDVYAIGVALYKTLTGRFPYKVDGGTKQTIDSIVSAPPLRLRRAAVEEIRPEYRRLQGINEDLECILQKALAKERERRYQSAAAFAEDLQAYLDERAVAARSGHQWYQLRKVVRRYRVPLGVAALLGIVVGSGLVVLAASWRREAAFASVAQDALHAASFVRMGQTYRNADRIPESIAVLERAIQIGERVPDTHPLIREQLFTSHYVLSELLLNTSRPQEAATHRDKALDLANRMVAADPTNLELRRLLAFSYQLSGRDAAARGDWTYGLAQLIEAEEMLRQLPTSNPDDAAKRQFDLALILLKQGQCLRKLDRADEAWPVYEQAREMLNQAQVADPTRGSVRLELSRVESEMAVAHMERNEDESNAAAATLLAGAAERVIELRQSPEGPLLKRDIERLLDAIERNAAIVKKRLDATASTGR